MEAATETKNMVNGAARLHERMQKRHQARTEDAERRKESKQNQSVAEENIERFSSEFNERRACIEELLASCAGADRSAVSQKLEEATARTAELQKFLNESTQFLTQYELRQAQGALRKIQASFAGTRDEALPKKKFAFRSRTKAEDKVVRPETDTGPPDVSVSGVTKVDGAITSVQCGFSGMKNTLLTMTAVELKNRDVVLTHLTSCQVRLYGSPSTLHLKHIDSCEILCGPVATSVFVDHCKNSVLSFPCQQLRTHNTTDTQVYLHVTSRAIIEDCSGVGFAPFSWSYPTLEEDFSHSGLERDRNNWSQVDDFNWLTVGTPSPHWTVIPEAERKNSWDDNV